MGCRTLFDDVVRGVAAPVRSGGKLGDRYILWRPDLWRDCDAITDLLLGTCARSSGFRDGLHSLLA